MTSHYTSQHAIEVASGDFPEKMKRRNYRKGKRWAKRVAAAADIIING
jgi:hypothetical protein